MKLVDLGEPSSFLHHLYLQCTQRECKPNEITIDKFRRRLESRISAGANEKTAWKDTLKNPLKDISNWQKKKQSSFTKSQSTPCLDDHHFKEEEELESFGDMSQNGQELVATARLVWSRTFITQTITDNIVTWKTRINTVDRDHRYAIVVQDLATQWIQSSVENKNLSGDGKSKNISRAVGKAESRSHWQFLGIWQSLWRSFLESFHVNTAQIRDKWDCWEISAQSKRRYLCSIVAIKSGWKLVGRFYGMLYLSAKHSRSLVWWEDTTRETFWETI